MKQLDVVHFVTCMSTQSRYEYQHHHRQHRQHQDQQEKAHYNIDNNNDDDVIYTTTSIWLSGPKQRPTLYLSTELAKKFRMNVPCKIVVSDNGDGILLRWLHPIVKHNRRELLEI